MPERDLELLIQAARESGEIARRYWRNAPQIWDKGDEGPVTEADLAVNDHLLARLRGARPDYGWLSEETEDDTARLQAERVFIVDPIDGTRAFIDGQEGFSHALAVADGQGQVLAAVVHLPIRGETYAAHAGGPALLNGEPIHCVEAELEGARILTSRASSAVEHWRDGEVPQFRREFRPSLAWRLALVAAGRFGATMSLRPAWEWDIAAGALIAERAGCAVSDQTGAPLRFNGRVPQLNGMLVAAPGLHQALLARLAPAG